MTTNLEQLVSAFNAYPYCTNVLQQLTAIFKQQTDQSLTSFVPQTYQTLQTLENKIWQLFCLGPHEWFSNSYYSEFLHTIASFNKLLIFHQENIKYDIKVLLLIVQTNDQINEVLQHIQTINDHNDAFITFASLWFDNLSFFVHENPQLGDSCIIIHINQYITDHFIMTEEFQNYLSELQQTQISSSILTAKQLFYIKTCTFSLNAYFYTNPRTSSQTVDQIIQRIGDKYIQIIKSQTSTVHVWSKDLLGCMTHLVGFMRALVWWEGDKGTKLKLLFPTEKVLCEYIVEIIRIIDYKPFYERTMTQWINDETILIDATLLFLVNIVQTQNIAWYFRSLTNLPDLLLQIADTSPYYRICLCAYGILSEILTDEHLKNLRITSSIKTFFFCTLEQAWKNPTKKYKQIPITYHLRGFLNLSKNDFIQQKSAELHKVSLFIEMSDEYPIAFDIIWALSFNPMIQEQLRSNSSFMSKLAHLEKETTDEQMRKTVHGILWNLEINHEDHPTSDINDGKTFDIMISYSHKEKTLCKQLYEELTKAGYRVWIDFDQMHGNVMDAMAQAIEKSDTIIICMSEQYRKSNYCRAEAHYAFQRQRKIVPVLLQKHYRPDGWLLFLVGHLLYVDFIKYDFNRAMELLLKELKAEEIPEISETPVERQEDIEIMTPVLPVSSRKASAISVLPQNMLEWTRTQVKDWLLGNNLVQMARLLADCDGRSLLYMSKYMKHGSPQEVLSLFQEDSRKRINENLSVIELSCFQSLMDQQKRFLQSADSLRSTKTDTNIEKKDT